MTPLVPAEKFTRVAETDAGGEGTMYAEVNEVQRLKATESIKMAAPNPMP